MLFVDGEERASLESFKVRESGFDLLPCAGDIGRSSQGELQFLRARHLTARAEQQNIDFYLAIAHSFLSARVLCQSSQYPVAGGAMEPPAVVAFVFPDTGLPFLSLTR